MGYLALCFFGFVGVVFLCGWFARDSSRKPPKVDTSEWERAHGYRR